MTSFSYYKPFPAEVAAFGNIVYHGMCVMMFLLSMAHSFVRTAEYFFALLAVIALYKMIRECIHLMKLRRTQTLAEKDGE